jgi:hypothetical protein
MSNKSQQRKSSAHNSDTPLTDPLVLSPELRWNDVDFNRGCITVTGGQTGHEEPRVEDDSYDPGSA